jgi:hypothetical protein
MSRSKSRTKTDHFRQKDAIKVQICYDIRENYSKLLLNSDPSGCPEVGMI